jgi:hypothetical protein
MAGPPVVSRFDCGDEAGLAVERYFSHSQPFVKANRSVGLST